MNNYLKYTLLIVLLLGGSCRSDRVEKKFIIGFSQCTMGDSWRKEMVEGMTREASFYPEITMMLKDAGGDNKRQIEQIEELIRQKTDLIIASPNESGLLTEPIEKALKANIPVILVDRRINSDNFTAFVGADNYLVGQNAGIYANSLLKGKGNILEIGSGPNTSPSAGRHAGFVDAIIKYPGVRCVKSLWTEGDFNDTLKLFLSAHPDIDLIFTHNDRIALSVFQVCASLHLRDKIKIIGVDGLSGENEGLDLVQKGMIDATILYPTGGEEAIKMAVKILKKEPFNKENLLPTTVINSENVGIMSAQFKKLKAQQTDIERQNSRLSALTAIYSSQRDKFFSAVFLLILSFVFGSIVLYLLRQKQLSNRLLMRQNRAILEQKNKIEEVSEQARQAVEDKLRFYSYISHEFRTPLSLILSPVEDILRQKTMAVKDVRHNILLVQKNAYRLKSLVDQLLDLRKADAGKLTIRFTENDLVKLLKDIAADFKPGAEKKRIDLQIITEVPKLPVWFDIEKLDKVFYNLISNALKYTPDGGMIHIRLLIKGAAAEIQIQDNGAGMKLEEQQHVFDLFYSGRERYNFGTGIGLALAREFIQLHYGKIEVTSEKNKGALFTILLPLGKDHLKPEEIETTATQFEHLALQPIAVSPDGEPVADSRDHKNTIVVIEDDAEMGGFLKKYLGKNYQIVSAETAEKGWEAILEYIPDMIVSDVMLPGMDGIQLTEKIKSDFRTSHIPTILLTAKGQVESKIEGAKAGADVYMEKPFNLQYLDEQIRSILSNREKIRQYFATNIAGSQSGNRKERRFLIELEHLIEQHLSDHSFNVEKLSRAMGMSRVQLYRKVLALTNHNISDYIGEIRLNKAKILLQETNKSISEVAYELGFGNPSYFTSFFKQKTGKTPSEFKNAFRI